MTHEITMDVRDYECDMQGIVNNGVYFNYLEHARHKFIGDIGLSFGELAQKGVNLVVYKSEITYVKPLKSRDAFTVFSHIRQVSPLRFQFVQSIRRASDRCVTTNAVITTTGIDGKGRPHIPETVRTVLINHIANADMNRR